MKTLQNVHHARGTSTLKVFAQKPAIGYEEFDPDHAEVVSSQVGAQRLSSTGSVDHTTFYFGSNQLHSSSTARLRRSLSPSSVGPDRSILSADDEFAAQNYPNRLVKRIYASNTLFGYELCRAISRDEEPSEWRRKQYTEDNHNKFESSAAYNLSNGRERQGPRALIDAYGSDDRKTTSNDMPLHVGRLDLKSMDQKTTPMSWQNTEEEEFDWEDMSPTLTDRGRSNDFLPSSIPPFRNFKARPGFGASRATPLEPDIRSNWSSQAQLPAADDSSSIADDSIPSLVVCFLDFLSIHVEY